MSLKLPAKRATVLVSTEEEVQGLLSVSEYIKEELNVRELEVQTSDRNDTKLQATPDSRLLGKRLGCNFKKVAIGIKKLSSERVAQLRREGRLVVEGQDVLLDEVIISRSFLGDQGGSVEGVMVDEMAGALFLLDVEVDEEALAQSSGRQLVNRLQKLKKKAQVSVSDALLLGYQVRTHTMLPIIIACNDDLLLSLSLVSFFCTHTDYAAHHHCLPFAFLSLSLVSFFLLLCTASRTACNMCWRVAVHYSVLWCVRDERVVCESCV